MMLRRSFFVGLAALVAVPAVLVSSAALAPSEAFAKSEKKKKTKAKPKATAQKTEKPKSETKPEKSEKSEEKPATDDRTAKIKGVESEDIGTTFELALDHAPFGQGGRYSDNTVMVFVPKHYRLPGEKGVDFLVHFHGHNSAAKDVIGGQKLSDQVRESRQNVVLVVPQGPVNASDSDFGELMKEGALAKLLQEVREVLSTKKASGKLGDASIRGAKSTGKVVLSSHSGGYHAAVVNLTGSGCDVRECYFFDALYDDVSLVKDWVVAAPKKHKVVSYYIGGKTETQSVMLAEALEAAGVKVFREKDGDKVTRGELTKGRGVFLLGAGVPHYSAPTDEHPLRECLRASCLHGVGGNTWGSKKNSPRET
ncbi:MAG: hypothetical protein U0414_08550 [Polyangiaceae bacterium]